MNAFHVYKYGMKKRLIDCIIFRDPDSNIKKKMAMMEGQQESFLSASIAEPHTENGRPRRVVVKVKLLSLNRV